MKALRLIRRFDRERIECEVAEEMRFHLDLLTQEHLQREMSVAEAKDAARTQFGNVEQITNECVAISNRRNPLTRAFKVFLIPTFMVGILVRVFSSEPNIMHVGETLILCAVLGRLFFYVRGLQPSSFNRKPETAPLRLNDDSPSKSRRH